MRTFSAGLLSVALIGALLLTDALRPSFIEASSHREAPMILNDPQADNTDLYAYRDPTNTDNIILAANYIPLELPSGGPNYSNFGENVRYEIHVKNQTSVGALGSATDDITYRFTFEIENEDPTTFFNIRLGQQNQKATYTLEKSMDGGDTFTTIVTDGVVAPNNVGPRSIENATVGLGTTYDQLTQDAITMASTGETIFVGPRDDPFFVDLGGVFDVGNLRDEFCDMESDASCARDEVAGFNTHAIVMRVPIEMLQKDGNGPSASENILDADYVIGVWASASRPQITTLSPTGDAPTYSGPWVQVSRLGMPLTNEVIIPIGDKDKWNATSPYDAAEQDFVEYFANPELGLYMGNGMFGPAVPGLSEALTIQQNSYPALGDLDGDGDDGLDFNNGADGVWEVAAAGVDLSGTAFAVPTRPTFDGSPTALAAPGKPRLVDIFPIFYFGVPNAKPYHLATGKTAGPLSEGKPFIHNFLPITQVADGGLYGGDMLRLNMATPITGRDNPEYRDYAHQGLIRAAAIGLTAAPFNTSKTLEFIPHMDGFPNGRRLEDDVTTIELQAVAGLVLAAVGLPEDDATAGDYSDLASAQLVSELTFVAGPTANDVELDRSFPFMANPHNGYSYVRDVTADAPRSVDVEVVEVGVPDAFILNQNYPNPFSPATSIDYHLTQPGAVNLSVYDLQGRLVRQLVDEVRPVGTHTADFDATGLASGTYFFRLKVGDKVVSARKATLVR